MKYPDLKNNTLVIFGILLCSVILLYANTLYSPFVFDDEKNLEINTSIRDINKFTHLSTVGYRHAISLSYALNYLMGKLNPFGYHLFNITLHACTALLVFLISHITIDKGTPWGGKSALKIALPTALLFTANPAQSEAITYISGRPSSLTTLCFLLSLFLFIRASLKTPTMWLTRPLLFIFSIIFFFLSVISKEIAVTLPLIIILYDFCFMNSGAWIKRKTRIMYFYILLPVIIVIFAFKSSESISIFKWWLGNADHVYALNQVKVIAYAIKLFFLPVNLTAEYHILNFIEYFTPEFALSALFWLIVLYLTAKYKTWKSPILLFSVLWYLITISPTNSIIPREDMFSERNLYLPSFGACLFFTAFFYCSFATNPHQNPQITVHTNSNAYHIFICCLTIIITCYSSLLITRNFIYSSKITFWEDTYKKTPHKLRVLHNLSVEYMKVNDYPKALSVLQNMQSINPDYYFTHVNLAKVYMHYGDLLSVETECKKAIKSNPELFEAYFNLGSLYAQTGRLTLAEEMYTIAKRKTGGTEHQDLYLNLASVYFNLGRYVEAETEINRYLSTNQSAMGKILLAQIYGKTNRNEMAKIIYLQDIKEDPKQQAIARHLLGLLYVSENKLDDALKSFENSISFNPKLVENHLNIAKILIDEKKEVYNALPHLKIASEINTDPQRGELIRNLISQITEQESQLP